MNKHILTGLLIAISKYVTCYTLANGIKNAIEKYMDNDRSVIMKKEWFGYSIYYDCNTQNWASEIGTWKAYFESNLVEIHNGCTLHILNHNWINKVNNK